MINKNEMLEYIKRQGKDSSLDEISELINSQNREEIYNSQSQRYRYEIWDKKSSINGVKAKTIIDSRNYTIGQVYLIYIDNKLVYFQDHNPNENGYVKMTKAEINKIAQDFIDKKINENVDNIIKDRVIQAILSK